jgi:RES domain-containing protein
MAHLESFKKDGAHRLIPAKYAGGASVLENLPLPPDTIADLTELDAATNERKIAERGGNPAIGPGELLYGVPEAHIVNAAFAHPGLAGGRFNDPRRGAWYAAIDLQTSVREVGYHKRRFLRDARINDTLTFEYQDFLADFAGDYHFLDDTEKITCLQPEPIPECYAPSQALASSLLFAGSPGIVYPSVRHPGGTCIACFRPALVFHPRRGRAYRITVAAQDEAVKARPYRPAKQQEAIPEN